ncbi:MAG: hypothetical protein HY860_05115 [Chlamydiales bacterium]|nr:hypothetical protein [Chlamydiales bacterium]
MIQNYRSYISKARFFLIALVLFVTAIAYYDSWRTPALQRQHVFDRASLLSSQENQIMEQFLQQLNQNYDYPCFIFTSDIQNFPKLKNDILSFMKQNHLYYKTPRLCVLLKNEETTLVDFEFYQVHYNTHRRSTTRVPLLATCSPIDFVSYNFKEKVMKQDQVFDYLNSFLNDCEYFLAKHKKMINDYMKALPAVAFLFAICFLLFLIGWIFYKLFRKYKSFLS